MLTVINVDKLIKKVTKYFKIVIISHYLNSNIWSVSFKHSFMTHSVL